MTSTIRQIFLDTAIHHDAHAYHQRVIGLQGEAEFETTGSSGFTRQSGMSSA